MGHMPNLKQVIDVLETLYPLRYAEEWDEPGLIVGDLSHDVHRIVFAADPTSAIIDKAIATGADQFNLGSLKNDHQFLLS